MAKIPFGILGPFIGKVGPVIGYIRGDTWCIRSMPMHYRDARTPAQLVNRSKLTCLMQFLCSMKPVIRSSFDVYNSDNPCRTEFNMAFAENFHRALRTTNGGTEILYNKVLLADGLIPTLSNVSAFQSGSDIHISWSPTPSMLSIATSKAQSSPADRLCLCAHNPATNQSIWNFQASARHAGQATFTLPQNWQSTPIHLWAWFSSSRSTSPSIYLGKFEQSTQNQKLSKLASRHPLLRGVAQRAGVCIENTSLSPLYNLHSTFCNLPRIKVLPRPYLLRPISVPQTTHFATKTALFSALSPPGH